MSNDAITNELPPAFRRAIMRERAVRLLDRVAFVSLLVLLVLVAIPYGTVEPWWVSSYECAVFALAALWTCEGLIRGTWNVRQKILFAPFLALAAFVLLQSIAAPWARLGTISADPFETHLVFLKLLAVGLNALMLIHYTSTRYRMRALIHVVIVVAVVSAGFGIVRQALQHSESGFLLPYLRRNSGFAQFVNKDHFALLALMAIGLATGFIFGGAVRRKHLLLYISCIGLMWTGLVMTNSRGGLLSLSCQIVFLIGMSIWLRSKRTNFQLAIRPARSSIATVALTICLLAVVGVGSIWVGGDVLASRLASLPGEITPAGQEIHAGVRRREIWSATWRLIKEHPLVGSGFGAYNVAITKFHDASGKWTPEAAHNDYLELLASGGLIGATLVVWFGVVVIKRARRRLLDADAFQRAVSLGALTGIVGLAAHSVVDFGLHVTANAVVLMALVVIATRDLSQEDLTSAGGLAAGNN